MLWQVWLLRLRGKRRDHARMHQVRWEMGGWTAWLRVFVKQFVAPFPLQQQPWKYMYRFPIDMVTDTLLVLPIWRAPRAERGSDRLPLALSVFFHPSTTVVYARCLHLKSLDLFHDAGQLVSVGGNSKLEIERTGPQDCFRCNQISSIELTLPIQCGSSMLSCSPHQSWLCLLFFSSLKGSTID
jgi:hypothetical protein